MEKCKVCKSKTDVIFNISFKATHICESCATSIFLQQSQWYSKQTFSNESREIDYSAFKTRREDVKMSMQDVSNQTEISKSTISRIERGSDAFYETVIKLDNFYSSLGV
tara:strand:+ start:2291 stop:2617 length:327 start_codon:yes stop_codon:yes gene_type:complete